ncbi:MAG: HD domain-containing protein [Oscillospiraceae bacterium]|nr:HD domain-containing protein [Oscillospiraceae bacterium]
MIQQQCFELEKQNKVIFKAILDARRLKSLKDIPNYGPDVLDTGIAYNLANIAHNGAVDKGGNPYINHPTAVASQFSCTYRICTAYLHDVVEDTDYTVEMLIDKGIDPRVAEAVRHMTHTKNLSYSEYLEVVSKDPIAVDVKIADMLHNSDLSRIKSYNEKTLSRMRRYNNGLRFLAERNFGINISVFEKI